MDVRDEEHVHNEAEEAFYLNRSPAVEQRCKQVTRQPVVALVNTCFSVYSSTVKSVVYTYSSCSVVCTLSRCLQHA